MLRSCRTSCFPPAPRLLFGTQQNSGKKLWELVPLLICATSTFSKQTLSPVFRASSCKPYRLTCCRCLKDDYCQKAAAHPASRRHSALSSLTADLSFQQIACHTACHIQRLPATRQHNLLSRYLLLASFMHAGWPGLSLLIGHLNDSKILVEPNHGF